MDGMASHLTRVSAVFLFFFEIGSIPDLPAKFPSRRKIPTSFSVLTKIENAVEKSHLHLQPAFSRHRLNLPLQHLSRILGDANFFLILEKRI